MNANQTHNSVGQRHKKQAERKRLALILISFVLIIFSLGTVFGCFICSRITSCAVNAQELPETAPEAILEAQVSNAAFIKASIDENLLDFELQATMLSACEKYSVPFALALAVAEQESEFNTEAVSETNDYGIMQINKCNFDWLRKKGIEPLDHKGNIEAGVLILSEALKKHSETELALMAYNCGDAGAKKLWKQGIYSTKYSRETLEHFKKWDSYIRGV